MLARLKTHRAEQFDPLVAAHRGRIIKLMGDGTLVEFASVVDAVACALALQERLAEQEDALQLRIGVNLGDVMVEGDDVYGEGVNIAARLEVEAPPGGICISHLVRQSLGNKLEATFESLGERRLKNIPEPLVLWQWQPRPAPAALLSRALCGSELYAAPL